MQTNPSTHAPLSLFEKIWRSHTVLEQQSGQTLLYIDRHYLSDDLPPESFHTLTRRNIPIHRPDATVAMPDHYVSTRSSLLDDVVDEERRDMIIGLQAQAARNGIIHFGLGDERQGIIHVVGPEQGLSLPGMTVVCGDSHTSTHGALGAFGFGIGATEVSHVLATQTLWQVKPLSMQVNFMGDLVSGVTAKDLALAFVRQVGVAGATGHVIEYCGAAIENLSIEGRMTLCNLSIEAGARAGMVAPDAKTLKYLKSRPFAPSGNDWDVRSAAWLELRSDPQSAFDRVVQIRADAVQPMVSWGIDPSQCCAINECIPALESAKDDRHRHSIEKALAYMGLEPGQAMSGLPIDRVFIGSCTNGRIEDLRLAASVIRGRKVKVPTLVVPGSGLVRSQAEAEGLDQIFLEAGVDWGTPGCSMCLAVNGDQGRAGERCVSTSNRNFVGRQGAGVRTHLVNPGTAAAAAITGCLIDYREVLVNDSL
ncbi:3-isopropylmalate dehydratase large subunit [Pseudomonas sp. BF-R-01]|jgi:3-isopropylmalate/(R)-2-methylmalate dehydratase large subunit|uniref:3-isopropylmalate dehydratase large subunit n=1 Tax=Pseudomonas sp. BF-R-01 TaxID=2832365 RepID=UPI001CBCC9EF|nr:3-isopropylmalate dehydratase large subunit [Pseudomonas sp. BF-R-01]